MLSEGALILQGFPANLTSVGTVIPTTVLHSGLLRAPGERHHSVKTAVNTMPDNGDVSSDAGHCRLGASGLKWKLRRAALHWSAYGVSRHFAAPRILFAIGAWRNTTSRSPGTSMGSRPSET